MPRSIAYRLSAALVAALLAAAPQLADAQWKWKDKTGRVQYSDLPPPTGTPEADILSRPGTRSSSTPRMAAPVAAASAPAAPVAAASGLAPKSVDPELEAKRKKFESEQLAKKKAEEERDAAARAESCKRAQAAQRTLDSGIRLARVNEKGEREILDDKQRVDEDKKTKDVIAADCK